MSELFFLLSKDRAAMNRHLQAAAGILLSAALIRVGADTVHRNTGTTTSFDFLRIGYDARSVALGGASAGLPGCFSGLPANPAALGRNEAHSVALGYRPVILDIRGVPLSYSVPVRRLCPDIRGVVGASIVYFSYGSLDEINRYRARTGVTWNPYALAGGVSWADVVWDELAVGATIKGIYDRIGSSAGETYTVEAFALDAGAQYHLSRERLVLGITMKNLGFVRSAHGADSPTPELPLIAVFGLSYIPPGLSQVKLVADMRKSSDDFLTYRTGLELDVYEKHLFLRGGLTLNNRDIREGINTLRGEQDVAYQKPEWTTGTFGIGFRSRIETVGVRGDLAYQTRVGGLPPSILMSTTLEY